MACFHLTLLYVSIFIFHSTLLPSSFYHWFPWDLRKLAAQSSVRFQSSQEICVKEIHHEIRVSYALSKNCKIALYVCTLILDCSWWTLSVVGTTQLGRWWKSHLFIAIWYVCHLPSCLVLTVCTLICSGDRLGLANRLIPKQCHFGPKVQILSE